MKKQIAAVLLTAAMLTAPVIIDSPAAAPFCITAEAASAKLAKPTSLKASVSGKKITLSWEKVSGAEAYRIYQYDSEKEKYVKVKDITKNKTTITVKKTGTYKFKISSLDKQDGKFVVGNGATVKATVKSSSSSNTSELDEVFSGLSWGMSKEEVIKKKNFKKYTNDDDIIFYSKSDDVTYFYQFKNDKLNIYGLSYKYSSSNYKKAKKLFTDYGWSLADKIEDSVSKDGYSFDILIYTKDNRMGTVAYDKDKQYVMTTVMEL
ncbi:MAG: hypothetical protein ACI4KR_09440 [Ruminiclostridium sp.]